MHVDSSRSPTEALPSEAAFVHRLARALLRDAGLAHDVAQDALAQALQQQPVRHLRGWLAAVTKCLAARVRRDQCERPLREARAARPVANDSEERTVERLRVYRRLTDAVMALPEPYRTAVTLRFFDELPPRAIARRLGLPAATVRQHVHRGLALLRQQLDAEFGGREQWRGAFATLALGKTTVPLLAWLPVLVMKKALVGAALVAAVGLGWWSWTRGDAPPVNAQVASSAPLPAAAAVASAANETKVDAVRTAAPVPAVRDEAFVVRVIDEREQPVAGADVHRWTAAGAAAKLRTDRDGRAEFAAIDGAGGVLVRADNWTPLVRELASLRGEQVCTLPDGAVLDGQMLVDGAPAPAGLRLGLYAKLALPESAPRELREAVQYWSPSSFAVTAAGGAFVFRGLTADRKVKLELPGTHWFGVEEGSIDQTSDFDDLSTRAVQPARGVLLRTTRLPGVHGRVVWADDGSPVSAAELSVCAQFADGDGGPIFICRGNDDGTFATGFWPASSSWRRWRDPTKRVPLTSVQMSVQAAGSDGSIQMDLDAKALAAMPVEVRLPRAIVTHFVVTDLEDHPIAGARVSAVPGTVTDDRGRGTFHGNRDKVLVGADGYQVQPARSHQPAAGTENDPLRFRLAPRNHLVLHVRDSAGGVAPIPFVRIRSRAGHLFCGKRFHNSFDETFGGSFGISGANGRPQPDGSTEMYEWTCRTRLDANGRSELHSLEPGVPCTAEASDSFNDVLASMPFVMPPAGETVTLDIVVPGTARTLRGRVQARDGTPLPKATIRLGNGKQEAETSIKEDGSFTFAGVYGDGPFELRATASGYAKAARTIAIADAANEHVLVLDPGQRVTLRIVDHEDRPVPAPARAEVIPGDSMHPQTLAPGEHLFTDLPSGVVTFESAFGGNRFRLAQDSANPNAVLRVPRPARIVVAAPKGASTDRLGARATRLDGAGEPFSLSVGASDPEAELLVPGRYRVELYRVTWRGQGETLERVEERAAPPQEIEAKAGELVRIQF